MIYYFGSKISENLSETPEGFLIARNVPIARIGRQDYMRGELGLMGDTESMVKVYRHESDVFDKAAVASFEGKDVTDGHPPEGVDPSNHAAYSKGHVQNVRREGDFLVADLHIKDPVLISEVKNGVKREVSCGYNCSYVADGDGYKQTEIRGNHVAVVPRGRAGHDVAIKDSAETAQKGRRRMSLMKAWFDYLAGNSEEAPTAKAALDAEPAEKAPDVNPAAKEPTEEKKTAEPAEKAPDAKDEGIPKGDDLGTKLDKLIERLDTIEKRLNGHGGPSDEKTIDEELTKLAGETGGEGGSDVIEVEYDKDACGNKDAAIAILKAVRPAVAAIKDPKEKAAIADALINVIRGDSPVKGIQQAAKDSAKKAADAAGKTDYEKVCEAQQAAYNARNPHMKKKEEK